MTETQCVAFLPLLRQASDLPYPARTYAERVGVNVSAVVDGKGRGLKIVTDGSWQGRVVRPDNPRLLHDRAFDNVFNQLTRTPLT